jgi:hypothetical protein
MKTTTIAFLGLLALSALPSCTTVQPVATVPVPQATTTQQTTTAVEPYTGTTYKKTTTTSY